MEIPKKTVNRSAYSELRRNTLIIAIANLGSKAIGFIIAPLYSYYLTTAEYGTADLIATTVSLLLPFICFDIFEACFRYSSDDNYDHSVVFSSSIFICFSETTAILLIMLVTGLFVKLPVIVYICLISAIIDAYYQVLAQYARGRKKMISFAFSGVLHSLALLGMNLVLMVMIGLGLKGYIISFVASKALVVVFLFFNLRIWKVFKISHIQKKFIREAIRFCLPLIPSASMWWIMNASDRYVISILVGVSATGIYAVANKLPALLSVFENVFYQAWQTTAINTLHREDRNQVYSSVFLQYFEFLAFGVLGILMILKPMIIYLFADAYHDAWLCSSVLVIGVMVHALAGNLGTIYTVFKKTGGAFKTSAIGAVTNIVTNIIFVKLYGYNAAAWTTLFGYLVVLMIRWQDIKEFVKIEIPKKDTIITVLFILAQLILYYIPGMASFIGRVAVFLAFSWMHRNLLIGLLRKR